MDNNGYSSNNETDQEAGNNLHPNRSKHESEQTKGVFLFGVIGGIAISALTAGFVYVGIGLFGISPIKKATLANTKNVAGDMEEAHVVNEDTIAKLETIEDVIDQYYYQEDDIDTANMAEWMYAGMVASLGDPYSVYYTQEEWADLMEDTEGVYYGIGAYISLDTNTGMARISGVIKDTPAEKAGLRENDLIYLVDGESVMG